MEWPPVLWNQCSCNPAGVCCSYPASDCEPWATERAKTGVTKTIVWRQCQKTRRKGKLVGCNVKFESQFDYKIFSRVAVAQRYQIFVISTKKPTPFETSSSTKWFFVLAESWRRAPGTIPGSSEFSGDRPNEVVKKSPCSIEHPRCSHSQ